MVQLCEGVHHAHQKGIVPCVEIASRDVRRPESIVLAPEMFVAELGALVPPYLSPGRTMQRVFVPDVLEHPRCPEPRRSWPRSSRRRRRARSWSTSGGGHGERGGGPGAGRSAASSGTRLRTVVSNAAPLASEMIARPAAAPRGRASSARARRRSRRPGRRGRGRTASTPRGSRAGPAPPAPRSSTGSRWSSRRSG
jgi:hypothetical protein